MFNAERLLGSLLTNALGQGLTGRVSKSRRHGGGLKSMAGSLISQNKTAIGMGLTVATPPAFIAISGVGFLAFMLVPGWVMMRQARAA